MTITELSTNEIAILNLRHTHFDTDETGDAFKKYIIYEARCHIEDYCKDNGIILDKDNYEASIASALEQLNG